MLIQIILLILAIIIIRYYINCYNKEQFGEGSSAMITNYYEYVDNEFPTYETVNGDSFVPSETDGLYPYTYYLWNTPITGTYYREQGSFPVSYYDYPFIYW